jgi:protein-L-isoaspartate(D-aspartate) O-methyltransferase
MDRAYARHQMVRQQVRTWDVSDEETLDLLDSLRRHEFVPPEYVDLAYADTEIPLPHGEHMLAPLIEGRVLQALDPLPGDRVFEVGAGSGFFAACLASMADSVVTVDIYDDLVEMARSNLSRAGIGNVECRQMDAMRELPDEQFDVIAVTGGTAEFDERFVAALKPGGRLFTIVGDAPVMEACLVRRGDDGWTREILFETCVKTLFHGERETTFTF